MTPRIAPTVPVLDASRYPIVISTLPPQTPTEAEIDAHFDEWRAFLRTEKRYVGIVDLSFAKSSSAMMRKKSAAFIKETEEVSKRLALGTAYVVESTFVRGVLTAIFWAQPPFGEYVIVATLDEAIAWCEGKLRAAGMFA